MIERVLSVGFTVSNLEEALAFYTRVLPFRLVGEIREVYGAAYEQLQTLFGLRMRVATLQLGQELIELTEYLTPQGRPIPPDSRSNDGWFQHIAIVVSDMAAAYGHLRDYGVRQVSTAPQTLPAWNKAAAGIKAFYFRDLDGHNLELIQFPPDKGEPRWQQNDKLFLGIDHTAIAIASTTASRTFYQSLPGLGLAGESFNYGIEQAHLNHVEGAHLHISSLRPKSGMGLEFLEYLQPRTGRPMPTDTKASDLWHWQTTLLTQNVVSTANKLQTAGYNLNSLGIIELPGTKLGFKRGFMVLDPDGHALRIVEPEITSLNRVASLAGDTSVQVN